MEKSLLRLFARDVKKALGPRSLFIWIAMSAICVFFFFTSNGRHELVTNNKVEFMAVMLPQIIFGAWAVLAVSFDTVSGDREHNVLDVILCSGVSKNKVFLAKILTLAAISFILSLIYLIPITFVIIGLSGETGYISVLLQYLLPLWGYIMVYASLGLAVSVFARSSKAAMIWSLALGLILMPRFFMLIVEGLGGVFGWAQATMDSISLISPGVLMNALADFSDMARLSEAALGFSLSILAFLIVSCVVFRRQDEMNYGE